MESVKWRIFYSIHGILIDSTKPFFVLFFFKVAAALVFPLLLETSVSPTYLSCPRTKQNKKNSHHNITRYSFFKEPVMPSRIGLVGVFRWQPAAQPMCIPAVPAGVSAGHSIASPCTMPAPAITLQLTEHSMYVTLLSRVILLAYKKKSKVLVFHWASTVTSERKESAVRD